MFNKKFVYIIILLLIPLKAFLQQGYYYGKWVDGATTYIFGDNVNVREAPLINSKSLTKLKIGTKATIISNGGLYELNGLQAPWYEVNYGSGKGWVWGGFLSLTAENLGNDLILYGLSSFSTDSFFMGELKYVKNNKLIASHASQAIYTNWTDTHEYTYSVSSELYEEKGFDGISAIIKISFLYEACAYTNGDQYYAWDGKKFIHFANAYFGSDAGAFSYKTQVNFPWNENGEKNTVKIHYELMEFDETIEDYKLTEQKDDVLEWKNNMFNLKK